jgi:ABC-type transport system involved in multi-copper enzyme maturation permease subunit
MTNTTPTPHGAGVIHDLAYRRYAGARRAPAWRVLVIARYALITQWRQRGVRLSLLAALLFAVIAAAAGGVKWGFTSMMEREGAGDALRALVSGDGEAAVWAMRMQFLPSLLLVLQCGAPAISADLNAGAFQFHFSRPVTVAQYLAGRMISATLWAAVASVSTLLLLCGVRAGVSGRAVEMAAVFAKALLPTVLRAAALGALSLGVSSLSRQRGIAQAMFLALVIGTMLAGSILAAATERRWLAGLDLSGGTAMLLGQVLGDWRLHGASAMVPGLSTLAWCALPLALAAWRLSHAEVVRG